MTLSYRIFISSLLVLIITIGLGCTTTKKTRSDRGAGSEDSTAVSSKNLTELQNMLAQTRSKLSDVYTSQTHDMPKAFLREDSSSSSISDDPYDGYRVQIISTRDKPLADSVANKFRMWSDTTIAGYSANAYIFFKQPFYKVHIGDFQGRDQANSFSKLIKRKYPDAWVVHDRINPSNVPADTTSFSIIPKEKPKESGSD